MQHHDESRQPIILLGASNLTLGWSTVADRLVHRFQRPLDILVAMGMGRSYLKWSRFLLRRLPSIRECEIWNHIDQAGWNRPPAVLLTDIGNDLVYGFEIGLIVDEIAACIERLRSTLPGCDIVMSALPIESIASTTSLQFATFRRLLFPGLTMTLPEVQRASDRLNEAVERLAETSAVALRRPKREWFGLDPIHIRRSVRREAFQYLFEGWSLSAGGICAADIPIPGSLPTAQLRTVLGRTRMTPQPCRRTESVTVSAY